MSMFLERHWKGLMESCYTHPGCSCFNVPGSKYYTDKLCGPSRAPGSHEDLSKCSWKEEGRGREGGSERGKEGGRREEGETSPGSCFYYLIVTTEEAEIGNSLFEVWLKH